MGEFKIQGQDGYIVIGSDKVFREADLANSHRWLEFEGYIEIKSGKFHLEKSTIWFSFDDINSLYVELEKCYKELNGKFKYENFEHDLEFEIMFDKGHVRIDGSFQENSPRNNKLSFTVFSDQSYFDETLKQIKNSFIDIFSKDKN